MKKVTNTVESIAAELLEGLQESGFKYFRDTPQGPREQRLDSYCKRMADIILSFIRRRANEHQPSDAEIFGALRGLIAARYPDYHYSSTAASLTELFLGFDAPWEIVKEICARETSPK